MSCSFFSRTSSRPGGRQLGTRLRKHVPHLFGSSLNVNFDPLRASARAQTTGRRLHKTDLARVQSGPQGPGRCVRFLGRLAEGMGR